MQFNIGDIIDHTSKEVWQSLPHNTLLYLDIKNKARPQFILTRKRLEPHAHAQLTYEQPEWIKTLIKNLKEISEKCPEGYRATCKKEDDVSISDCVGSYRLSHSGVAIGGAYPWRPIEKKDILSAKIIKFNVKDNDQIIIQEIKNYLDETKGTTMNCQWCKNTGKLLLVDNYVNCTECEKGKQIEKSEKKIFDQYDKSSDQKLIVPEAFLPSAKKELIIPTPHPVPLQNRSGLRCKSPYITDKNPWIPPFAPSILGNAGIPGCGSTSANPKTIFFSSERIESCCVTEFEISAGEEGAFIPRKLQIIGRSLFDNKYNYVRILCIYVMGIPVLGNCLNKEDPEKYVDSEFFKNETDVSWTIFGKLPGQGLKWIVYNPDHFPVLLSIKICGDPTSVDLIGMR